MGSGSAGSSYQGGAPGSGAAAGAGYPASVPGASYQ
jgi:hypothetical protein